MPAQPTARSFDEREIRYQTIRCGLSVPYVERGSGAPLVLLHGTLCDLRFWDAQCRALSAQFRCVAPSMSHYWPAGDALIQPPFGWRNHVDEMAEFIESTLRAPVHLVGLSRGASIAYQLARLYPECVRSLVLCEPNGAVQSDTVATSISKSPTYRTVVALLEQGEIEIALALLIDALTLPGTWAHSPPMFQRMARDNVRTLSKDVADALPAYSRESAAQIRCATLLIDGQYTHSHYRRTIERLGDWLAHAGRVTIPGAGHGVSLEKPAAFNRAVQRFVSQH